MHRMASHTRRYATLPLPRSRREPSRFLLLPILGSLRVPFPFDGRTRINWRLATMLLILVFVENDLERRINLLLWMLLLLLLLLRPGRRRLRMLLRLLFCRLLLLRRFSLASGVSDAALLRMLLSRRLGRRRSRSFLRICRRPHRRPLRSNRRRLFSALIHRFRRRSACCVFSRSRRPRRLQGTFRRRRVPAPRLRVRVHPYIRRPVATRQDRFEVSWSQVAGDAHRGLVDDDRIPGVFDALGLRFPLDGQLPHEADERAVVPIGVEVGRRDEFCGRFLHHL